MQRKHQVIEMLQNLTFGESLYQEEIRSLAVNRTNKIFYNSNDVHAAIVLSEMIKNAKDHIDIFCQNMCSEVSNSKEYLDAMESFLSSDSSRKVRIILADYKEDVKNKPIYKLLSEFPDQVTIKRTGEGFWLKLNDKLVNFTVTDDVAYRLEVDIDKKMAMGNFNDPERVKPMVNTFDQVFNLNSVEPVFG